jgi:hypothetical protein
MDNKFITIKFQRNARVPPRISCEVKNFVETWFPGFPLKSHPAFYSKNNSARNFRPSEVQVMF